MPPRLSNRRGLAPLPEIEVAQETHDLAGTSPSNSGPASTLSSANGGTTRSSSLASPFTPTFDDHRRPQLKRSSSEGYADWSDVETPGLSNSMSGLGLSFQYDVDGRRKDSAATTDEGTAESDQQSVEGEYNADSYYSPPPTPPEHEFLYGLSAHSTPSIPPSLQLDSYILDAAGPSSSASCLPMPTAAAAAAAPASISPDAERRRSARDLFRKVLPRGLRRTQSKRTTPTQSTRPFHPREPTTTNPLLFTINTNIEGRPSSKPSTDASSSVSEYSPSVLAPPGSKKSVELPHAPAPLEQRAVENVFEDAAAAPPLPPATSPLPSPLPAVTPTFESPASSRSPGTAAATPVERMAEMIEQMNAQDAAFDAAEKRMLSSGWSSEEEIGQLRQKRALVRAEWQKRVVTFRRGDAR